MAPASTDSNKAPHKADQIPVGEAAESDWGEFVEAVEQTQPSKSAAVQHYQRMAAEAALLEALKTGLDMLHPGRATAALAAATIHHPACGDTRRSYLSAGDAMAYEAGFLAFDARKPMPIPPTTPFAHGWIDAAARDLQTSSEEYHHD